MHKTESSQCHTLRLSERQLDLHKVSQFIASKADLVLKLMSGGSESLVVLSRG